MEIKYWMLEDEADDHPVYHAYFEEEGGDVSAWAPEPPASEGWFTLSIHDTEDGAGLGVGASRRDPGMISLDGKSHQELAADARMIVAALASIRIAAGNRDRPAVLQRR